MIGPPFVHFEQPNRGADLLLEERLPGADEA
jgi:hypothetical protein